MAPLGLCGDTDFDRVGESPLIGVVGFSKSVARFAIGLPLSSE